ITVFQLAHEKGVAAWSLPAGWPSATRRGLSELAISPDGKLVAYAGPNCTTRQEVRLRDLALGRERVLRPAGGISVFQLCFSPDSRTLAVSYVTEHPAQARIELLDLATGHEIVPALSGRVQPIVGLAFAPDGQTLA